MRSFNRRGVIENGLDEEIRFHIDQQTEKNIRAGMSPSEARRQAHIKFGGVERTRVNTRAEFRLPVEDTLRDIRYGARALRRSPGFTAVAALTLALGISATTTVFSVVNGVLIKPLPYPDSEALVGVWHVAPGVAGVRDSWMSASQFFTYRENNRVFQEIGVWSAGTVTVTGLAEPEQVPAVGVTFSTLLALGEHPAIGRGFSQQDDMAGAPRTVILTYDFWQRRYGGDRSAIGRSLIVDSSPRQVIGVMPAGFTFLNIDHALLMPLQFDRAAARIGQFNYPGLARLKPGVTLTEANADIARMIPMWLKAWPEAGPGIAKMIENARFAPALRPLKQYVVGDIGNVLWLVMGTIGIVLVIACANIANLLLVRVEGRHHELAVRAALGAGWRRISRELFLECLVLGFLGGAVGLALTLPALRLLAALGPSTLPRLNEITIDTSVVVFAVLASLLSSVLFALIPIAKYAGTGVSLALRSEGRTSSQSRDRYRTRDTLVVAQVALSLVLLVSSGLMIRTFLALRAVDPGFTRANQIQLVRLSINPADAPDPRQALAVMDDIRERIGSIPGVSAVSFARTVPMGGNNSSDMLLAEDHAYSEGQLPPVRRHQFVSPGFFTTLGTPFVAGRDITWSEVYNLRSVGLISENLAREMWREPSAAIGKRIREHPQAPWREIVGVVRDLYADGVSEKPPMTVYWPILIEKPWRNQIQIERSVTFVIRSSRAGTEAFLKELRERVWSVNPHLPLAQVRTLEDVYRRSLARPSFTLVMLAIAAGVALVLGVVGIYGVISFAVAQRTREIGIRIALGAQQREVKRMFLRYGLVMSGVGVAFGLIAAVAITRWMTSLLFGVSPLDPTTYAAVSLVLMTAATLASYVPAHRATAVDPVEALRAE